MRPAVVSAEEEHDVSVLRGLHGLISERLRILRLSRSGARTVAADIADLRPVANGREYAFKRRDFIFCLEVHGTSGIYVPRRGVVPHDEYLFYAVKCYREHIGIVFQQGYAFGGDLAGECEVFR